MSIDPQVLDELERVANQHIKADSPVMAVAPQEMLTLLAAARDAERLREALREVEIAEDGMECRAIAYNALRAALSRDGGG